MSSADPKPGTMADIARRLGVTTVSVSLALRNSPLISQELRERVRQLAEEVGFRPRPYRRRAKSGSVGFARSSSVSGRIGVLFAADNANDPVAAVITNSIVKRLTERKVPFAIYSCEELYVDPSPVRACAGVIFHYCLNPIYLPMLEGIPQVAVMHEEITFGPWDSFKPHEVFAGRLVADYLLAQGFRRVMVTWGEGQAFEPEHHARLEGFRQQIRAAGFEPIELVYPIVGGGREYVAAVRELLDSPIPLGVFAFCDQAAYRICNVLQLLNRERIPGELEVVSCDNTYLIKEFVPPLPVVDLHIAEIASRAVDGMIWRLENPEASYQEVLLRPELILP